MYKLTEVNASANVIWYHTSHRS